MFGATFWQDGGTAELIFLVVSFAMALLGWGGYFAERGKR